MQPSYLTQRLMPLFFVAYVFYANALIPALSPLRILQIVDPAVLKYVLNPLFVFLFVFSVGRIHFFRPVTAMQLVLIYVFIQATLKGGLMVVDSGAYRAYWSHLFQLASAYAMFSVGMVAAGILKERDWARAAYVSLAAAVVALTVILWLMSIGKVARFYSPVYGLMPALAYFIFTNRWFFAVASIIIFLSNRRGMLISLSVFVAMWPVVYWQSIRGLKRLLAPLLVLGSFLFGMLLIAALVFYLPYMSDGVIGQVFQTFVGRIEVLLNIADAQALNNASSGRLAEIRGMLATMEPFDWIFGNGAGWQAVLPTGQVVHNIHFSWLSISAVFGAPFAVFLYFYAFSRVVVGFRLKTYPGDRSVQMASLYLLGALVFSFTAYSLFIDMLVFLFLGVIEGARRKQKLFSQHEETMIRPTMGSSV